MIVKVEYHSVCLATGSFIHSANIVYKPDTGTVPCTELGYRDKKTVLPLKNSDCSGKTDK